MREVTLVTGGGRSGKSRYALELARAFGKGAFVKKAFMKSASVEKASMKKAPMKKASVKRAFIATAEAIDDEMRERIARHRAARGEGFLTVEAPRDPARAIRSLDPRIDVAVVDCLTVWLGNLLHADDAAGTGSPEVASLLEVCRHPPCELILVTNEVGMGIVPANDLARRFRDLAGAVNQEVASVARRVVLMVSGLPVVLKGKEVPT